MRTLFQIGRVCLGLWLCAGPLVATGSSTRTMIERVLTRNAEAHALSGTIEIYEKSGARTCDVQGQCVEPFATQRGTIAFARPFLLRLETTVEQHNGSVSKTREKLFLTDGTTSWQDSILNPAQLDADTKLIISRNSVTLDGWVDGSREVAPVDPLAGLPADPDALRLELSLRMSGLVARPTSPFGVVPAYLLEPFRGIDRSRIEHSGTESVHGVPCDHFVVHGVDGAGISHHWIARSDGVVRKIEEMSPEGKAVRRRFELRDVVIRDTVDVDRFTFENDGRYEVEDVRHEFELERRRFREILKGYPAYVFARHFDAPVDRVRNLRGAMFQAFLNMAGFLRFESESEVGWMQGSESEGVDFDAPAARDVFDTLLVLFPEDRDALRESGEITIRRVHERRNGNTWDNWLVHHRARALYFFVDRYTG
jgi:outer membrane lipoprotein-sorting protein